MSTRTAEDRERLRVWGGWLRAARLAAGVTVQAAGEALGLQQPGNVSEQEHGHIRTPRRHLPLLAELYRLDMHELARRWAIAHEPWLAEALGAVPTRPADLGPGQAWRGDDETRVVRALVRGDVWWQYPDDQDRIVRTSLEDWQGWQRRSGAQLVDL